MKRFAFAVTPLLLAAPANAQLADPNELGVSFAHVHLSTTDLGAHAALWSDLFGGETVEREGYTAVAIPGALVFFTEQEPTAPSVSTSADHFGFKVRDIEAVLSEWRARGNDVDDEWTSAEGRAKAYITMPDGVRLELEEDPDLAAEAEMHHVHIYTPQHRDLREWYVDLFAAEPRARGAIETTADVPGANLSFSSSEEKRAATDGTAIDHVGFEVENMEGFVETLQDKGVSIEFGPLYIEGLDLWVAFFTDPSGVLVEVTEGLDHFAR